jgi:hypothetical protein
MHVFSATLVPCSSSKVQVASAALTWGPETTLDVWNSEFLEAPTVAKASELYTGRVTVQMLNHAIDSGLPAFVISAGAGLVAADAPLPSYEATFSKPMSGPKIQDFGHLPYGAKKTLEGIGNGLILSFAPPLYHLALLNCSEMLPFLPRLVVPHTSPMSEHAAFTLHVPGRAREVFGCSSRDLTIHLHELVLNLGPITAEAWLLDRVEELPPKPIRRTVTDRELDDVLRDILQETPGIVSTMAVRHLRDVELIAASVERVKEGLKRISPS